MNLEEKITHLQEAVMNEARMQGNHIYETHRTALERLFEEHKEEARKQSEIRIKSGTTSARTRLNKAKADVQTNIKREEGKCKDRLKKELFQEVELLVEEYMKTPEYMEYLSGCIVKASAFANGEELTIFLNPSDEDKKAELEARTGMHLTISKEDFTGGIRAVIRGKNILIDRSFKSAIAEEYDAFTFPGGDYSG
ncbi:MAG TPA: hypothetical protein DCZ20_04685 [Lachnospiraceae bacterium]|nr:hypothetical protein [Lachnospiraceae bacterium]